MAAVENNEIQQVFDSRSYNNSQSFELSSPLKNDFAFLCNGLDSFLESLDSELLPKGSGPSLDTSACAVGVDPEDPDSIGRPPLPRSSSRPRTSVTSKTSNLSKVLLKDYDCPKPLIFFNKSIPVGGNQKFTRSIEFNQRRPSSSVDCLSECRFPPQLRSLYKGNKPSSEKNQPESEVVPSLPKTRRRRQRNRLSLSDHAFDNDDAHGRRNLLPTDEDLRTTFDKVFDFHGIPYIFKCSRGKFCECPSKCAQLVNSFSLYMEINHKPGTQLHPLVRENIACVTEESCVVNECSALVAVTAVQCKQPPLNRLFIPVSYHLKDKIGCLKGIVPEVISEMKIDESVRGVVTDLLDFVDRQLSFTVKDEYDPDYLSSAENSFNEVASQENINFSDSIMPESTSECERSEQRKKRGKCKEQNKVLRELRKLMNISVTDETEEVKNHDDVKCTEQSCSLGCVCGSVHVKYNPPPDHCGNIGCMFECVCSEKTREMYLNLGDLSKDEKSWHQTVIRKRNNALEIMSGVDRTKRRKKMPSRYDNTVTGYLLNHCVEFKLRGDKKTAETKEYRTPVSSKPCPKPLEIRSTSVQKQSSKSIDEEDVHKSDKEIAQQDALISHKRKLKKKYLNKIYAINERRLKIMCTAEIHNLLDVMIWCNVHYKYDCYCMNRTFFGKNNNVVCKLPSFNRFAAEKYLAGVSLEPKDAECRQVVWYDQSKHCARTFGSIIDYNVRNKNALFKRKLLHLLSNNIISFSNSFTKAKPIALFLSDVASDNYPFVPDSSRKITGGVGSVVKITNESHTCYIDVGGGLLRAHLPEQLQLPSDDLQWESSDDEIVDKSDFLLDDDASEFIPKPKRLKTKVSKPVNQLRFSSVFNTKTKPPAKYAETPKIEQYKQDSDSDIEVIEDPIETYSLSSSPEPTIVDGGTLSDSSSCKDAGEDPGDSTFNSKGNNDRCDSNNGNQVHDFTNNSAMTADCDSFSSPDKLVIDEESMCPVKSVVSHPSINLLEDSLKPCQLKETVVEDPSETPRKQLNSNNLSKSLQQSKKVLASLNKPSCEMTTSDIICERSDNPLHRSSTAIVEDNVYPKHGLFCMSLPNLGYLRVIESRPGNFIMEDPCNPKGTRIFKNCKEASEYMKQLVALCINPEYASSEWVMVTRGVLEKYKGRLFDNSKVVLQKKRKPDPSKSQDNSENLISKKIKFANNKLVNVELDNKARGQTRGRKVLNKNVHSEVQLNSSDSIDLTCDDIFQYSHKSLTSPEYKSSSKVIPLSGALKFSPQPGTATKVNNLVGTFPNLSEANSFIEKNYQTPVVVASNGQATGTTLMTGTSQFIGNNQIAGKFIRLAPPMLTGPKMRGGVPTTTNKTLRTMLVRGGTAGQTATVHPVLHIRPPGLKVAAPVFQTPNVATVVSTTHAGVHSSQVDTMCHKGPVVGSAAPIVTLSNEVESTSSAPAVSSSASLIETSPRHLPAAGIVKPIKQLGIASTPPLKNVESSAPIVVSSVALPGKQVEIQAESANSFASDSVSSGSTQSRNPSLQKLSDSPRVPDTYVIESFSTSSSPVSSASSLSTLTVRHGRTVMPKPVIPKVPPRRADVIVPRNDDFATLISPAPSESPATKVPAAENTVFNGVLLPKSDRKEFKGFICHKKPSNFRSLLQKR